MTISAMERYPSMLGQPTQWDGGFYAFAGDVVQGTIPTVAIPANAFEMTRGLVYTNVPSTLERIDELLVLNPESELLGPFPDDDANIRQVRTRRMMFVPPSHPQ
jgi:hypothetical protein